MCLKAEPQSYPSGNSGSGVYGTARGREIGDAMSFDGLKMVGSQGYYFTNCYRCNAPFAMSDTLYHMAMERRGELSFYCPNGHGQVFKAGEREEDKLRRERDQLKQRLAEKDDQIRSAYEMANEQAAASAMNARKLAAAKGQITKIKKRASNGVCPCCNRTFTDLARHMHSKHPGFVTEPDASEHVN